MMVKREILRTGNMKISGDCEQRCYHDCRTFASPPEKTKETKTANWKELKINMVTPNIT